MNVMTSQTNSKANGLKVMVVDDDPISLELLTNFLQESGYTVAQATNGKEALEKMRFFSPRIVISDVDMPEMNGVELCRAIRNRQSMQYTYLILLTCHAEIESVLQGLDAGADDYLSKPFRHEELRLRLEAGRRLLTLEGRDMMIFSLAKLAESRDNDTGTHLERIREYSKLLATDLMNQPKFEHIVDAQFVELIYLTSPLHDVGKVGIPDQILLKPGKLTEDEFEVMKRHTLIGGETLSASAKAHPEASFLKMALDITLKHHERWDGTGYPFQLKGEEIPLSARIVAVADVYDALTTKRVYKAAFTHEVAAEIIYKSKGSHFDPDIVDAFARVEEQMRTIRLEMDDESPMSSENSEVPKINRPSLTQSISLTDSASIPAFACPQPVNSL
jgi:putative two-component system response regulator